MNNKRIVEISKSLLSIEHKFLFWIISCFSLFLSVHTAKSQSMMSSVFACRVAANPAYATVRGIPSVQVYRNSQWSSFPGSPVTYSAIAEVPFTRQFGVGVVYFQDQAGLLTKKRASLLAAYNVQFDEYNEVSFGLGFAFFNQNLDYSKISNTDPVQQNDPQAANYNSASFSLDGDFGLYYQYNKMIGLSISLPNVKAQFIDKNPNKTIDNTIFSGAINGIFDLQGDILKLEPSIGANVTKYWGTGINVGARVTYENQVSATTIVDSRGSFTYGLGFMYNNRFLLNTYHILNFSDASRVAGSALEFGILVFFGERPLFSYD